VRTFKSSIRVSLEEGRVSSLDPRSLSWRWGLRAIIEENDVVLWMRVVYHGRKRLKERREWRSEEELKEKGLVCFVLFLSLSFYLVGVTGCACVFRVRERECLEQWTETLSESKSKRCFTRWLFCSVVLLFCLSYFLHH
jgi:hypothetical protein